MSIPKLKNALIFCLLFGMLLIGCGGPIENGTLGSLGVTVIYSTCLLLVVIDLFEWRTRIPIAGVLLVFLLIRVLISFFNGRQLTYSRVVPFLVFLELPIMMTSFNESKRETKKIIFACFWLFSFFYIALSMSDLAYIHRSNEWGNQTVDTLTLGYANPNQTAMYLLFCLFVLQIAVSEARNKLFRLLLVINEIALVILIYLTQSRAGIVISVCYLGIALIKRQNSIGRILSRVAIFIPVIFMVFMLVGGTRFSTFEFLGESFDTGRREIFTQAIGSLNSIETILWGNYRMYASQNLHNSAVSILVEYGLIVLVIYEVLLANRIKNIATSSSVRKHGTALLALCLIVVYSSVEAAFFISGSFYAVSVFVVYYLGLPEERVAMPKERKIYEGASD